MSEELTCRQAFDRLEEFLDRELSADEATRVHAHLTICEPCTREFHFEASILEGVREKLRRIKIPGAWRNGSQPPSRPPGRRTSLNA